MLNLKTRKHKTKTYTRLTRHQPSWPDPQLAWAAVEGGRTEIWIGIRIGSWIRSQGVCVSALIKKLECGIKEIFIKNVSYDYSNTHTHHTHVRDTYKYILQRKKIIINYV